MRVADRWTDYELLDTGSGERLERWGDIILIRPDTQVIWDTQKKDSRWKNADARYIRSNSGGGRWEIYKKLPDSWSIGYDCMSFTVKTMGFKHTGIFPEQAVNWDYTARTIQSCDKKLSVLNLFGYSGCATVSCMRAGAAVCHVDASKGMVSLAKENAAKSGVADLPVRWIVDDCIKFVAREQRRGNRYDAVIMDPPSYGRGPGGEVWKLEEQLYSLVCECSRILSEDARFFLLNSYTAGLSPAVMEYILGSVLVPAHGGRVMSDEIGLRVSASGLVLPCGNTAIWEK